MTAIDIATARILTPAGLDAADVARTLGVLAGAGADLGDLYFESLRRRHWRLEDGRVAAGGFAIEQGVGARAAYGGAVAFAYSADLRPPALLDLAKTVRALQRRGEGADAVRPIAVGRVAPGHALYPAIDAVADADAARWIALLERIDTIARAGDPRIVRVDATRLTAPIDGATLIGVGHEALKQIDRVGHDLALDDGEARCGKQGQSLDVGVGQPTIRIGAMMVGGRGA